MVPFAAEHYTQMDVQHAQAIMRDIVSIDGLRGLECPYASTLMQDGLPLACAGAAKYWEGRALLWSFLSSRVDARNFRQVHAAAHQFLSGLPYRRLEASVEIGFEAGHRWLRLLGFKVETPLLRRFGCDGSDHVGYVLLRGT